MMKQTNFLVEIVATENNPTIIIRDPRGIVVKVTKDPNDITSFLEEVVKNLYSSTNNESSHE